jgi:serine/arginine repetitive matrix protein 2
LESVTEGPTVAISSPEIFTSPHRPSFRASLWEARAIPSLNFSSINLLAKLNDALEQRRASLGSEFDSLLIGGAEEALNADESRDTQHEEPVEDGEKIKIREKYRSLFLGLDEDINLPTDSGNHFKPETLRYDEGINNGDGKAELERPMSSDGMRIPTFRPLSPIEFLEEVRRISVPSIHGLTQRLSELLPTLRRHFSTDVDGDGNPITETINEIRHVGEEVTKEDVDLGLTANIEQFEARKSVETVRQVMSISEALRFDDAVHDIESQEGKGARISISSVATIRPYTVPLPREMAVEVGYLARLPSGRLRSLSDSDVDWAISERAGRQALVSRRSLMNIAMMSGAIPSGSPETTRPWNLASSYPWSNSIPYIDIHFPVAPSPMRPSGLSRASPLQRAVSPASSENDSVSALVVPPIAIAPNSAVAHLSSSADDGSPHLNPFRRASTGARILNTLSIARHGRVPPFSSSQPRHSRRNSSRTHNRTSTIRASSNTTVSDSVPGRQGYASSHAGSTSAVLDAAKAVDPGDRYPTSGLPAPSQAVLGWDDQSFFSEDSGDDNENSGRGPSKRQDGRSRRGSLRVRLGKGRWRVQRKGKDGKRSMDLRRSSDRHHSARADESEADRNAEEPTAMSHHEVKAKKLITRLKSLLWRGSELFRTMSGRKRISRHSNSLSRRETRSQGVFGNGVLRENENEEGETSWSEEGESLVVWGGLVASRPSGYDAGKMAVDSELGSAAQGGGRR